MAATSSRHSSATPIAIVGVSALFPGSTHKQAFWRHIVDGRDFITDVPPDHWLVDDYYDPEPGKADKIFARRGAFLPKVPFNPMEFGLPPNNLPSTDTVQLLALLGTKRLLAETRSVQSGKVARPDISVILGIAAGTELIGDMAARIQRPHWIEGMRRAGVSEPQVQAACDAIAATYPEWNESTFPGLLANVAAGRIANRFDLGGANCVIDAACASSLAALNLAVDELRLGKSDLVISGGCDALNDIFMFMCFTRTPAMSRAGDCRPFSDAADGTMLGEGVGLFALRRLEDAERDGDLVYAVIKGIGSSSDGSAKSVYAPRAEGQAAAIRRGLAEAGLAPDDIGLIEAHGTATKAGDAAEAAGLRQAFASASRADGPWCALGSIKAQIGHTKSAAGAAGLFKTVMALRHQVLPPTIKVDRPNPSLELENSAFYLNTAARPWIHPAGIPRRAGLSSFGFGGSNFHVVVEEYLGAARAPRIATSPTQLVLVGENSVDTVLARLEQFRSQVAAGTPLATLARASQAEFVPGRAHRLALVAKDAADFAALCRLATEKLPSARQALAVNARLYYSADTPAAPGTVAFLFPGQGSQYVGMGADLAMEFDAARAVWDRSAAAGSVPWHRLVFPVPVFSEAARQAQETELTRTENAQPALGLTSLAALALLKEAALTPSFVAGHSYGELVALFAAGVIPDEATLLDLSATRGRLMATAGEPAGAMLAVLGPVAELDEILRPFGDTLTVANRNSPQQVVVSGREESVAALEQRLASDPRWTAKRLPVSAAFHSALVSSAASGFAAALKSIPLGRPQIPVFANTTAAQYPTSETKIRSILAGQIAAPVRFDAQIEAMYDAGARVFVEVGPRSVMSRLVDQILGERPHAAIALDQKGRHGVASFFEALGRLSVQGVPVDYAALWSGFETEHPDPSATPPARGVVLVGGSNLGKPYPPANGAAGRTPPNLTPAPAAGAVSPPPTSASADSDPMSVPNHSSQDSAQRYALLEQVQRNVLEAHRHFQETLAQSHLAFLQTSEALLRQIGGANGTPLNGYLVTPPALGAPTTPVVSAPSHFVAPTTARSLPPPPAAEPVSRTMPSPAPALVTPRSPAFAAVVEAPAAVSLSPTRPSAVREPVATAAPVSAPAPDYAAVILATIARCTGYPVEMIELDMELEAGLGIDSIKKVEIFSALQEQIPALAQADASQVGTLATVRAILDFTVSLTVPVPAGQKKKQLTPAWPTRPPGNTSRSRR